MTESSLFIRLYLDEDVSVLLAQLLRPHGFDVLTTRDAKNLGRSDAAQLHFTAEHQLTMLTHNRCDYERLHETALREHRPHAGILIANRRDEAHGVRLPRHDGDFVVNDGEIMLGCRSGAAVISGVRRDPAVLYSDRCSRKDAVLR